MRNFLIGLFCLVSTYGFSDQLSGIYELVGSNNDSGQFHYRGQVTIVPQGDNYRLNWKIGKQTQTGVGILCNNVLSVAYRNASNGDMGVVSYYLTPEGNLEGKWAPLGSSGYGLEILTLKELSN